MNIQDYAIKLVDIWDEAQSCDNCAVGAFCDKHDVLFWNNFGHIRQLAHSYKGNLADSGKERQPCGENNKQRVDMFCALGDHHCQANVNAGYCAEGTGFCIFQVQSKHTSPIS